MDFGVGGCAGGSGGNESDEGASENAGLKRKWGDFETTMKALKDALVKDNEEKSAKIRKLMEENVRLEQNNVRLKKDNVRLEGTLLRLENLPFQQPGPIRPLVARQNPFDVFPPEVWKIIIEKITRYSDLEAFCLAFPQLEKMVKNLKKTIFLFEKVIPLICSELDLNDILNCRLVCDKWNQDLCALLENSHVPEPTSFSHGDLAICKPSVSYRGPSFKYVYSFEKPTKIQRFVDQMSDHPGNPLFGRALRFNLYDDDVYTRTESDNFWKFALQLVEKFGEHVWSFDIGYDRELCDTLIEFYKPLQQVLVHLPNLRNLQVSCFHEYGPPSETSINIGAQFWKSLLPPLPYLQSLQLELNSVTGMVNAFTTYFSNKIRRLELGMGTLGNVNLTVKSLRGLVNLQHLEVGLWSKQDILRLFEFPTANLKTLLFYFSSIPSPLDSDSFISEQFANLSKKFSRLEHLDLTWCENELSSFLGSRMRLTGLKKLEIAVGIWEDDFQQNLDFILQLSSLKHLVIEIEFEGRIDVDEYDKNSALKIRKHLYGGDMLDSNIWTLVPSLQLLECRGDYAVGGIHPKGNGIFTREMFESLRIG